MAQGTWTFRLESFLIVKNKFTRVFSNFRQTLMGISCLTVKSHREKLSWSSNWWLRGIALMINMILSWIRVVNYLQEVWRWHSMNLKLFNARRKSCVPNCLPMSQHLVMHCAYPHVYNRFISLFIAFPMLTQRCNFLFEFIRRTSRVVQHDCELRGQAVCLRFSVFLFSRKPIEVVLACLVSFNSLFMTRGPLKFNAPDNSINMSR